MADDEKPEKKQVPPFRVMIKCTDDGDVVLECGIVLKPHQAVHLARAMVAAAKAGVRKKPIIVPGGAFSKPS